MTKLILKCTGFAGCFTLIFALLIELHAQQPQSELPKTLTDAARVNFERYQDLISDSQRAHAEDVYRWSIRLLEAHLDEGQAASAFEEHKRRMQLLYDQMDALDKTGSGSRLELLAANYFLIEAKSGFLTKRLGRTKN